MTTDHGHGLTDERWPQAPEDECYLLHDGQGLWRCVRDHRPPPGGHAVIVTREAAQQIVNDPGVDTH